METAKCQKRRNEHRQQTAHLQLLSSFTFAVFTLKQCAEKKSRSQLFTENKQQHLCLKTCLKL